MSDNIPEEVLIEILLKLPTKSLIRSTSVCKAWQSLIESSSFISLHLSNAESQILVSDYNNQRCAIVPKRKPFSMKVIDTPLKCPIKNEYYRIVGSCDGLMCFSNHPCRPPIIVCNPTIRKQVVLPQYSFINRNKVHDVLLGFGVASKVYKVVRLVFYKNHHPRVEIFTLGTETWRKLSDHGIGAYIVRPYNRRYSWFYKGFLHWICRPIINENYRDLILTFHVGDEVFREIVFPEDFKRKIVVSLTIIGESFGAIINPFWELANNLSCDVWIMTDYGVTESWTKLYRIDCYGFPELIGILENSEVLLGNKNDLVTYNAETKGIKHVWDLGENMNSSWYNVDDFKESLVLLGGYSEEEGESSLDATSTIPS